MNVKDKAFFYCHTKAFWIIAANGVSFQLTHPGTSAGMADVVQLVGFIFDTFLILLKILIDELHCDVCMYVERSTKLVLA